MMNLAAELPGTVISHLLGLHPNTAEKWTRETNLGNSDYAAEVSRRATRPT
jgi:hypothetical protein